MAEVLSRREQKKLFSRQAILEAAVKLFSQKGVQETSIADIMNVANLGIGTFYNYFESKEDVLMTLLENIVGEIEAHLEELRKKEEPSSKILADLFMYTTKVLSENRFVLPLFLRAAEHAAMPQGMMTGGAPAFKEIFGKITREGQENGEFRKDIPAEVITEMFHSLFQAAAFSTLAIPFEENIRMKMTLIIDGMRAN